MNGQELRAKNSYYIYAIIAGNETREFDHSGLFKERVFAIKYKDLLAVVSLINNSRIRPERRHLSAHQKLLKDLMLETTPLPMSFGIIADDQQGVIDILVNNYELLNKQLLRVQGKVEMGLRVTWDVPNIFEYFIHIHDELRSARDHFFGTYREPTQEEKIELGRMFDKMLQEDRESHTEKVENILNKYCYEIKADKCRNEREVMNLACLVGRDKTESFEDGVFEAANTFDNNFAFDYNGPWAPHNFVHMELQI